MAQNNEGRFKLKEGDWFEIEVELGYNRTPLFPNRTETEHFSAIYLLNYQLKKQLPNNNQKYLISIDRSKIIKEYEETYFGYDSFYPNYKVNKTDPEIIRQYVLEVTPEGKIIEFLPVKEILHQKINLTDIGSSKLFKGLVLYSEDNSDSSLINIFSKVLMATDSLPGKPNPVDRRVPAQIKIKDMKLVLTDASFPIMHNAIVQGKLKDQGNQNISISMIGENSDYYFPEKNFHTNQDGSFACPIFLKRPLHLKIKIGDKALTTFMEPCDSLNIHAIGHQAFEYQNHIYSDTKPNEYYSAGMAKSDYFSGNAAYNTMLSNELDQFRTGFVKEKDVPEVIKNGKEIAQAVSNIINSYRGKASDNCIEYFQMDFQYFLAVAKFYFKKEHEMPDFDAQGKYRIPQRMVYPVDFFMEVDTLPILMKPYEWNISYQNFIKNSQDYKQNRLGMSVGKTASDNFMENYYFSMASLKGYPFYQQIAYYLDMELRKGSDINIVKPYYDCFLNNCEDPALTEPLKKVYTTAERFKIGNHFPFSSFELHDSTHFNLESFKGKPTCIVFLDRSIRAWNPLIEAIKKFKQDEVAFLIVKATDKKFKESITDTALLNLPSVTYIEVPEKYLKSEILLESTRIFMLDKWFRIVENNAEDPMSHLYQGSISEFEKSLRKAIEAKRYSKAEQSAMLKTAGWSLGSILFTVMVGLWIYRIRIRRIKQQEEAKRRIKELEIKAIRSQMNPHFIFNALNSIQSLINGNQFKEANIYLSKFAVLLRGVLNNSEKGMISLSDELKAVELYCQLEQLRFDFNFDIHIAEDVNGELIEIPGMIIQPLAENAVVHGISAKGHEGRLNIRVSRQNGNVCIGVADNGVGISSKAKDSLSEKGFGLKLVEERINILNLEGKEARLTVRNLENSSGTLATLIIPID
jgi:hypothetical protein